MHEVNYIDVEQGTDEWLQLKMGKMSASHANDLLMAPQYAGWKNYRAKLVIERLTGKSPDRYVTKQMEYGTEAEAVARMMFSLTKGIQVKTSGIYVIEGKNICASLDGEIVEKDKDGTLEIKNREIANHIESISSGKVPLNYYKQMQMQLWVVNRDFGYYQSYADEMPDNAKQFIKKVERDEKMIAEISMKCEQMEQEVTDIIKLIEEYHGK